MIPVHAPDNRHQTGNSSVAYWIGEMQALAPVQQCKAEFNFFDGRNHSFLANGCRRNWAVSDRYWVVPY